MYGVCVCADQFAKPLRADSPQLMFEWLQGGGDAGTKRREDRSGEERRGEERGGEERRGEGGGGGEGSVRSYPCTFRVLAHQAPCAVCCVCAFST